MKARSNASVLITGGAGFIGSHLLDRLIAQGHAITVLDNFNRFYDPAVKRNNIEHHKDCDRFRLIEGDLRNDSTMAEAFSLGPFDVVVHLAAMAGVRPSLENPALYMDVNVNGTQKLIDKILETGNRTRLVFGSSSSVYGKRSGESFVETDRVDRPLSPYAASKAAGELQCFAAHHTRGLSVVCLRFFTVYGPRQRTDLAISKFCHLIDKGQTIEIYGDGTTKRDYTYVDDIVSGIEAAMTFEFSGYEIINLGRSEPVVLIDMVRLLEKHLNKKANIEYKPMPAGDVPFTYANIEKARKLLNYAPKTSLDSGIGEFVHWYRKQYRTVSP